LRNHRCIKSDTSENQGIEGHNEQKVTANFVSGDIRCIKSEHRTLERNYKKEYKKEQQQSIKGTEYRTRY